MCWAGHTMVNLWKVLALLCFICMPPFHILKPFCSWKTEWWVMGPSFLKRRWTRCLDSLGKGSKNEHNGHQFVSLLSFCGQPLKALGDYIYIYIVGKMRFKLSLQGPKWLSNLPLCRSVREIVAIQQVVFCTLEGSQTLCWCLEFILQFHSFISMLGVLLHLQNEENDTVNTIETSYVRVYTHSSAPG